MANVLLRKFLGLGRDEEGAALVVTLALFMFLYASCAGVFAIGQSVKDRIHLQNACDAAAYSAAVVQADTLSRIATINRAMSWTYASLCNREMDCITYHWLNHAVGHYRQDRLVAKAGGGAIVARYPSDGADCVLLQSGVRSSMPRCLGASLSTSVEGALKNFLSTHLRNESFYLGGGSEISVLENHISADKSNIKAMNTAIAGLRDSLQARAENAAHEVLTLNLPAGLGRETRYNVEITPAKKYLLAGTTKESRFLCYSGNAGLAFPSWYRLVKNGGGEGIRRDYGPDLLVAEWDWWIMLLGEPTPGACPHGLCLDRCVPVGDHNHARLSAGMSMLRQSFYYGEEAMPLLLSKDYFGKEGTITVGVAKYNENPWTAVFRRVAGYMARGDRSHGIYGLFNPYKYVEWTWAVSSAKAGYQHHGADPKGKTRKYRVNYEDDSRAKWNLCTSDWDAVFVPVRQSHACAGADNKWDSKNTDFLASFMTDGAWLPLESGASVPTYNIAGNMPDLPLMHDGGGAYRNLNWSTVSDLMFH